MIVAFGHRKRTGKDTAAKLLEAKIKLFYPGITVQRVSFAYKLKQTCHDLFGWAGLQAPEFYELPENEYLREVVLPEIGKTPRQIWIEVGNKLREVYEPIWVKNALLSSTADVVIVADLRYPNEAAIVKELEGRRYKMVRDAAPVGTDVADCALQEYTDWTAIIPNNGTIEELDARVELIAASLELTCAC